MGSSSDEVLIRIRTQGGKASARDIEAARRKLEGLGNTGGIVRGSLSVLDRSVAGLGNTLSRSAGGVAKYTAALSGLSAGAVATQAARTGAEYNKMRDSQMVAFSTMLRSEDKARKLMDDIQALALRSPVLDPGTTGDAVRQLLNYGMSVDRVLPLVETLGDASAASGKSIAEVMPQAALALGQIEGKGKLSAEELNQITEAVGINRKILAKELGLTQEEFADAFKPGNGISSDDAIPAIQRALQQGSKGAAKRLSKTTAGQVDQLKEVMARELGDLTRPWYDAFGRTASGISDVLNRRGLAPGQKIRLSFDVAKKEFGPLVNELRKAIDDANLDDRIVEAIRTGSPKIVDALAKAMVTAAPRAASAFGAAFMDMGPWGQLLTVAFLYSKLRPVFSGVGQRSAGPLIGGLGEGVSKREKSLSRVGRSLGRMIGVAGAAVLAYELFKEVTGQDPVGDGAKRFRDAPKNLPGTGDPLGGVRVSPRQAKKAGVSQAELAANQKYLYGPGAAEANRQLSAYMEWLKRRDPKRYNRLKGAPYSARDRAFTTDKRYRPRAAGGVVRPGETTLVGERGPESVRLPPGSRVYPTAHPEARRRGAPVVLAPTVLQLDGKTIYEVVSRHEELEGLAR